MMETYCNQLLTVDTLYSSVTANTIIAKLANQFQGISLITLLTGKHYSLDSDFLLGCAKVNNSSVKNYLTQSVMQSHYTHYTNNSNPTSLCNYTIFHMSW